MKSNDLSHLLPPPPSLRELAEIARLEGAQHGRDDRASMIVSLTQEEFAATIQQASAQAAPPSPRGPDDFSMLPPVEIKNVSQVVSEPTLDDESLKCYVTAAALRYTFSLNAITPIATRSQIRLAQYRELNPTQVDALFSHLGARCEIVKDVRGNAKWLLSDDARREALKDLLENGDVGAAIEQATADAKSEAVEERERRKKLAATTTDTPTAKVPATTAVTDGEENEEDDVGGVEEVLWSYLSRGNRPFHEEENARRLSLVLQVSKWLYGLSSKLLTVPPPEAVASQLARATLLQPFRHLTGEWKDGRFASYFVGREEELSKLYDYLAVLPPKSLQQRIAREVSSITTSAWNFLTERVGHRPLLIHGPGGVGKSTLLAQFLLAHLTETEPEDRFPFVYLDFDLSALNVREPVTLLAEAAGQLAIQFPLSREAWELARNEWLNEVNNYLATGLNPVNRVQALKRFADLLYKSATALTSVVQQFGRGLPFLMVMDTFEEVQYYNRDEVKDVFRFINALSQQVHALRVILMGRATLGDVARDFELVEQVAIESDAFETNLATDFGVIEVPLGDLDKKTAQEYLMKEGISDSELAEDLVEALGANPLSLRLITKVVRKEKLDMKSLREETEWNRSWSDRLRGRTIPPRALLQGVLFRRILGHIHKDKIRDLVHPGLILRRITPDLIKQVLAGPCKLGDLSDLEARSYFDLLANEVSLVGTEYDPSGVNVLRHRPELRRIMLRLMEADPHKQDQIQQVHHNAVTYYAKEKGLIAREEELYHRLMLGEFPRPEAYLDDIPTEEAISAGYAPSPTVEEDPKPTWRALADAVDELPLAASTYLAARLNREIVTDEKLWQSNDQRDLELMVLGRCSRRSRERGNVISALESLRSEMSMIRSSHGSLSPASPLPVAELAFVERLGRSIMGHPSQPERQSRYREAIELHMKLRELASSEGDIGRRRRVEAALLMARSAAYVDQVNHCLRNLREAEEESDQNSKEVVASGDRWQRQLLRVTVDCYEGIGGEALLERVTQQLLKLVNSSFSFEEYPVLARNSIVLVFLRTNLSESALALMGSIRSTQMLRTMLSRLPQFKAKIIAKALADVFYKSPRLFSDWNHRELVTELRTYSFDALEDYFGKVLFDQSGKDLATVATIFSSPAVSDEQLVEIMKAFRVDLPRPDDIFVEAQRKGDLIAGEGPALPETQTAK